MSEDKLTKEILEDKGLVAWEHEYYEDDNSGQRIKLAVLDYENWVGYYRRCLAEKVEKECLKGVVHIKSNPLAYLDIGGLCNGEKG